MATLNFPTLTRDSPSELTEWKPVSNTKRHVSPYTQSLDTLGMVGTRWAFGASWKNLLIADRALIEAWLAEMDGLNGRFYYSHPLWTVPRGTARGTGTCSAASQLATTITLNGLASGATLLKGDFIEIGTGLLVRATANGTASGGGVITNLAIAPMLRTAVAGSTAFTLVAPKAQFMFAEENLPGMPVLPGPGGLGLGDFEMSCIEAF